MGTTEGCPEMGQISKDQDQEAVMSVEEMLADPRIGRVDFTDEEWAGSTERVQAILTRLQANPRAAELIDRKYAEISRRVQNLKTSGP